MLNEDTGYIRLTRFSRIDKEMLTAIKSLLSDKMTDSFDLRDNPEDF